MHVYVYCTWIYGCWYLCMCICAYICRQNLTFRKIIFFPCINFQGWYKLTKIIIIEYSSYVSTYISQYLFCMYRRKKNVCGHLCVYVCMSMFVYICACFPFHLFSFNLVLNFLPFYYNIQARVVCIYMEGNAKESWVNKNSLLKSFIS